MCEGNKEVLAAVHGRDIYWSKEKIEKEGKTLHGNAPQASLLKVDSKGQYDKYFCSKDGKNRKWKVVLEKPTLSYKKDAIYLNV